MNHCKSRFARIFEKNQNLHYTLRITPKRVRSGGSETAVGDIVSDLAGRGTKHQTSRTIGDVFHY